MRAARPNICRQKEPAETQAWPGIAVNPQAYLERKNFNLKTRAGRETVMYAVHRLARTAPPLAAQQWAKLGERFTESERGYVWGLIAFQGAQRHDPNALAWYAKAGELTDAAARVESAHRAAREKLARRARRDRRDVGEGEPGARRGATGKRARTKRSGATTRRRRC